MQILYLLFNFVSFFKVNNTPRIDSKETINYTWIVDEMAIFYLFPRDILFWVQILVVAPPRPY